MIMIGGTIGNKYTIESFVGSGGMAQVYRAHDNQTGKVVAIKILKDEFQNDAEFVRRFEREARAGLAISHNNVVRSLDVGQDHGMHYIVFEFINGMTLKDYIYENGAISPKNAVFFASQILDALEHAHELGIIHRDVKPQNVMITENGVAKLADFGIARDAAASTKTFTGSDVLGSVHYISPEQARGSEVTQQSDLYSVAIMLYEMLTGSVPFDSENSVSVALKHLSEEIQPPIELNQNISPALNDVILKACAKDPSMRYATAAEMKRDLIKSLNQPNGKFARQSWTQNTRRSSVREKAEKQPHDEGETTSRGALKIVLVLGVILAIFVIAFIIVTVNYNSTHIYVPDILGDTIEEAKAKVGDNFTIEEVGKVSSDQYKESGHIISQDPPSGSRADSGTVIRVTVSIDSDDVIVPDLSGKSLLEANSLISKSGLSLAKVEYSADSNAAPGRVYDQEPKGGSEVDRGTEVVIYISGEAAETERMPNVTAYELDNAISTLRSFGFTHVLVRYEKNDAQEGTVIAQDITPGADVSKELLVVLSVSGEIKGPYTADRAYNVTVTDNDTPVFVTVDTKNGYEIIVFEAVFSSGTQTAAFTARMDEEGKYNCIVYVGGVENRREEVRFRYE